MYRGYNNKEIMHVNELRAVFSILILFFLPYIQGSKTSTCEAPPVEEGKSGVISCKFDENVLRLKSFSLDFIPVNGSEVDLVTLVSCIGTDTKMTCKNTPDYHFGEPVNSIINVMIPNCDAKHTGRYMCTVMESEPGDNKPCDFFVQSLPARQRELDDTSWSNTTYSNDKTGKTDNTNKSNMMSTILPIVVVLLVVVTVAVFILIKGKRSIQRVLFGAKPLLPTTSSDTLPHRAIPNEVGGHSKDALLTTA